MDFQSLKKFFNKFKIYFAHQVLTVARKIFRCSTQTLSCSIWDLVSWPGLNLDPLHWEYSVYTTGPPGKSQMNGS